MTEQPDFTAEERERLREILEDHEWRKRLKQNIAIWAKWIGGALTASVAIKVLIADFFR